jgi:hypothetical protein
VHEGWIREDKAHGEGYYCPRGDMLLAKRSCALFNRDTAHSLGIKGF